MRRDLHVHHQTLVDQLKRSMLEKIATGEWAPGNQIPPEHRLSKEYGISPGTVRRALEYLENYNFIVRQQGRGTFVADPDCPETMLHFDRLRSEGGSAIKQYFEVLGDEVRAPSDEESEKLRLRSATRVRRIARRQFIADAPFLYDEIVFPLELFRVSEAFDGSETSFFSMVRKSGVLLGHAEELVTVEQCHATAAYRLGLQNGAIVMRIRSLLYTIDGCPARWRDAYCLTNGVCYSVNFSRKA